MALNFQDRFSFGIGGAVGAVKEAAYIMFVLLFYTQVLGLNGTATGIVLFVALVWDAITDPMVGSWSDRIQSRWGRRHPLMIMGAVPLGFGFVALFDPPEFVVADQLWLAAWLLFWSLWLRTTLTAFAIPQYALAPEMTSDYQERSRLFAMRTALLFLFALMIPALAFVLLFGMQEGDDGRFVVANYVTYGWVSAFVTWVCAAIAIVGTWKFIPNTQRRPGRMPDSVGLAGLWLDFMATLHNRNFRNILFYDLAVSASYGITVALNIILWTYFWELDADQTGFVLGLSVLIAVPLALLTIGPIGRRLPKERIVRYAVLLMLLDLSWPYALRLFELLPDNGDPLIFAIIVAQNAIFMYFFILRIVAITSLTADLTDEHDAQTGKRQEGSFYAVLQFMTKLGAAAGPLYGGIALDLAGLQEGTRPGTISSAQLWFLVALVGAAITPLMVVGWGFTYRFGMTEERLHELQVQIAAREKTVD